MTSPAGSGFTAIALLMFATGIGIPVLATWSGGVGQALGSPAAATLVIFAVGLVLSGIVLAVAGVPATPEFGRVPVYFYGAAALMIFYILSITWAGPRIGIGNAVFFVLLGQLVAAAAIDHFALFGALRTELTARRLLGIAVMTVGVYLARRPR